MMLIEADLYTEGTNPYTHQLGERLREFFNQEPFSTGLDWNTQLFWAKMTEAQCLMFCLKYPQYMSKFREV